MTRVIIRSKARDKRSGNRAIKSALQKESRRKNLNVKITLTEEGVITDVGYPLNEITKTLDHAEQKYSIEKIEEIN